MMTRLEALKLSEPLEKVYAEVTDQILVNIARHFNTGKNLPSLEWQMKKLAELGQVTQENIAIIAKATGQNEQLVTAALQTSMAEALKDVDPKLREAAMKGFTQAQPTEAVLANGQANALMRYQQQATEDLNMVNTVMLNSSLEQYKKVVADTTQYEAQLDRAQEILNETTGEAILGVSSRQQAIRKAVGQMAEAGLTGFIDKGGHHWSPEAYVSMDIRTTITNTAHAAVDARCDDYGVDLIEVTAHAGARPLCYPYQGKIYSRSNLSGVTTDLNGNEIVYEPFNTTSYGEPAGLFGINCGHFKYPFFPGLSRKGDWPVQDKEENDRQYAQSQQQRALEREIRYAKRDLDVAQAYGDPEAEQKARQKIRTAQANMREFIDETGRTRRYDREQIVSKAGAAPAAPTPVAPTTEATPYNAREVERRLVDLGVADKVFLASNIPEQTLQEIEQTFSSLRADGYPTLRGIAYDSKACAERGAAAFYDNRTNTIYLGKRFLNTPEEIADSFRLSKNKYMEEASQKDWASYGRRYVQEANDTLRSGVKGYEASKAYDQLRSGLQLTGIAKQPTVCESVADIINHEYGHAVHLNSGIKVPNTDKTGMSWAPNMNAKTIEPYRGAADLGAYALKNPMEAVAEAFALKRKGGDVPAFYEGVLNEIDQKVK